MSYSLSDAAKATGKNRTTIQRAIKSGKISASKNENGAYEIAPAELHRIFPAIAQRSAQQPEETDRDTLQRADETSETLRIRLEMLEKERERERAQLEGTIADLREDRDKWRQQATALLEDKRPQTKGFLKKLFGQK